MEAEITLADGTVAVSYTHLPAIDTGMLFLRILSPFYLVVSLKLVTDGILRGCGMMVRFIDVYKRQPYRWHSGLPEWTP